MKVNLKIFIIILGMILSAGQVQVKARAKYEPPDGRVIHGLGQYVSYLYSDEENWQLVEEYQNGVGKIPIIYSAYVYLDPVLNSVDSTNFIDITTNHTYPYILLVGLSLFDSTILTSGVTNIPVQTILSGGWDYRILDVVNRIKSVNGPVFLRVGYEFGNGNSGIHNDPDVSPTDFVNMWIYIYNKFMQENVTNVAWVWNTVNTHQFNYMQWYPGNEYVDWWGVNYFTVNQMNNSTGFLNDAAAHGKPVIICESNPIESNGTLNPANWNNWFVPYFNKIKSVPHLKAFVYVSDPWDRGLFASWPDSRITSNFFILQNYKAEMTDPVYIHMDEYLANPGIIGDYIPPDTVAHFRTIPGNGAVSLFWTNPPDPDFAGVRIMRDTNQQPQTINEGTLVYDSTGTYFMDTNLTNGVQYFYSAFAYDTVPNYSEPAFTSATPFTKIKIVNDTATTHSIEIYPNPAHSSPRIRFNLNKREELSVTLYDITGRKVMNIHKGILNRGTHQFRFDASRLPSGVYICQFSGPGIRAARKFLLLK
ncbi:MAG: hypothetical protein Kow0042_06600 [Calditrichia bacterium]